MKYERVQPEEAATIEQGHETPQITYGDLLEHVRERRRVELEAEHPGRSSNLNAVSNTTRSLTAFMEANDLAEVDVVGEELIGTTPWNKAVKALGTDSTAKRRRTEINKRVRPWAMELIRAAVAIHDDESFGERLQRLREAAGMSAQGLSDAVSRGEIKLSTGAIHHWERGGRFPSQDWRSQLHHVERALGVPTGYLSEVLPTSSFYSARIETGLPRSIQRRISQHLPADFGSRPTPEQDEILAWVSRNILSTPKEILGEGDDGNPIEYDFSVYALARTEKSRLRKAPDHLLEELDEVRNFKTSPMLPEGIVRNEQWGKTTAEKADYEILAFMGAVGKVGLPDEMLSLSAVMVPQVIDQFIQWKVARRGGYTNAIEKPLLVFAGMLHREFGFLTQSPGFGEDLAPVKGLISRADVQMIQQDWKGACARAVKHINSRLKEIAKASQKGRDPFEALLPVLEAREPLRQYYRIVPEIRKRMPDDTYPVRKAETLRSLLVLRLGLELAFRQKNNRELLICPDGQKPRSWKELKRRQRGELSFDGSRWIVRIPGVAFKNATSKAVHEENVFHLMDRDHLYSEIAEYLEARKTLLGNRRDPGTLFVKTMTARSKSAEYCLNAYYEMFRSIITTYGIHNPFTGRGAIEGLRPHGPHSIRHVVATASVKRTRGFSDAAALLMDSEEMVKEAYARFLPGERHSLASDALWNSMFDEGDAA
ncbi:helix-turn-helix domain-containing protein [Sulfitobacter sp. 1A13679]|uniref:helix-turn-helix domain-containing protein n=1 Tax=Sulfitobacter sp. 1A13679 TaxID=3368597 RepID=UPI0037462DBD